MFVGGLTVSIIFYQLTIMAHRECERRLGRAVMTDRVLCASARSEEACQADPGGLLVVRSPDGSYSLAGIFSVGMICSSSENIGVFTNISVVRNWLADSIIW